MPNDLASIDIISNSCGLINFPPLHQNYNEIFMSMPEIIKVFQIFCCSAYIVFCAVLLCVFTFWVACCDVRYDFRIKTMFSSSLPPVVCRRTYVYLCYLCIVMSSTYCVVFLFSFSLSCVLYIASFSGLPLRYSLTFIYNNISSKFYLGIIDDPLILFPISPICKYY